MFFHLDHYIETSMARFREASWDLVKIVHTLRSWWRTWNPCVLIFNDIEWRPWLKNCLIESFQKIEPLIFNWKHPVYSFIGNSCWERWSKNRTGDGVLKKRSWKQFFLKKNFWCKVEGWIVYLGQNFCIHYEFDDEGKNILRN